MLDTASDLVMRLARHEADRAAAERLRYQVFVGERGGDGPLVDHGGKRERDALDPHAEILVLVAPGRPEGQHVVGTCRLTDLAAAERAGGFGSAREFDLDPLLNSGRRLTELGRTCLAAEYRGGLALLRLWSGLARLIEARGIDILFGAASFPGADPAPHAPALRRLMEAHLAPPALRVRSLRPVAWPPSPPGDRLAAAKGIPPLIKSYLRLGGVVGEGACIDAAFNTVDVCMILDVAAMPDRARALLKARRPD